MSNFDAIDKARFALQHIRQAGIEELRDIMEYSAHNDGVASQLLVQMLEHYRAKVNASSHFQLYPKLSIDAQANIGTIRLHSRVRCVGLTLPNYEVPHEPPVFAELVVQPMLRSNCVSAIRPVHGVTTSMLAYTKLWADMDISNLVAVMGGMFYLNDCGYIPRLITVPTVRDLNIAPFEVLYAADQVAIEIRVYANVLWDDHVAIRETRTARLKEE